MADGGPLAIDPAAADRHLAALPPGITPLARAKTEIEVDLAMGRAMQAVRRAAAIGVDLIELHFAHGYLINSFLSPLINKREDQYGGGIENRMRFAVETVKAVREATDKNLKAGYILKADADATIAQAEKSAIGKR